MKNNDISSQLNFFSFAEVGTCDHLYDTAQNNQSNANLKVNRESAVARITNIFKKPQAETVSKPLTITAVCA